MEGADSPESAPFLFSLGLMIDLSFAAEFFDEHPASDRATGGISQSNNATPEGNQMSKLLSVSAAVALFAPVAAALLVQAAQIVA